MVHWPIFDIISALFELKNNNRIYINLPLRPLWPSGQSSWLQIQTSMFDSRHYQIFWEVVGLEGSSLSLVSTIEELLGRNSSGSGLENWEHGCRDPSHWPRDTLYPQKLTLNRRQAAVVRSVGRYKLARGLRPVLYRMMWVLIRLRNVTIIG
jgi:hypothetical protein